MLQIVTTAAHTRSYVASDVPDGPDGDNIKVQHKHHILSFVKEDVSVLKCWQPVAHVRLPHNELLTVLLLTQQSKLQHSVM